MEQSTGIFILPHATPNLRRPLSAQDWDEQRPNIQQLYLTEDRSLDDVIELMKTHHGFQATYMRHPPVKQSNRMSNI
jgi:hypothetical protein